MKVFWWLGLVWMSIKGTITLALMIFGGSHVLEGVMGFLPSDAPTQPPVVAAPLFNDVPQAHDVEDTEVPATPTNE